MDAAEQNRQYVKIQRWSIGIGVTLFTAGLASLPATNRAYEQWHADHTRLIVAEIVTPIQVSQQQTSDKLDFLVKAEAARLVDNLKTQLVILKLQEQTPEIRREIADLERRIERAVDYRDCLFANRPSCDALRIFQ